MRPTLTFLDLHRPTLRGALFTVSFGACVSAFGCGGGDNTVEGDPPIIPSVTAIAPGDPTCPTGGVRVSTGVDDDRDGVLSDSEIDRTSSICNGNNLGVEDDVLVRTVSLDPGVECPDGGRRLDIGLDNGDGSGTAGNATLEDGEVDTSFLDCNDAPMVVGVQPPTGPAGSFVLDTHGGSGGTGGGGEGGGVSERSSNATIDAYLMLSATGAADASCSAPTVTTDLGSNGLEVTSDLVVPVVDTDGESSQADGAVYTRPGFDGLLRWDATNLVGVRITGVRVAVGATLTLTENSGTTARVVTDADFEVLGTLTTGVGGSGRSGLSVLAGRLLLQNGSVVVTSGSGAGAGGGDIYLEGSNLLVALGSIDSRGSDGATGGDGGDVVLVSGTQTFTAGTIQTQGGTASAGDGGDGGGVFMRADSRLVCNGAAITADGGNATAIAGDGGEVRLGADCVYGTPLEVRSSGAVRTRGGVQTGTCDPMSCRGGDGGDVYLVAGFGGSIATSGGIDTRGGNSAGAGGGTGGDVYLDEGYAFESLAVVRHYDLSGNITTFGGDGATSGGSGGDIETYNQGTLGSASRYLGYASALLSGGAGGDGGGHAGDLQSVPDGGTTNGGLGLYVFDTDVTAVGGNGGTGSAGDGGVIVFAPSLGQPIPGGFSEGPLENFVFLADATLHGGDGAIGGDGGAIIAPSGCSPSLVTTGIRVDGAIDIDGGDGTTGHGGDAGEFNLATLRGAASLAGSVTANGGASTSGTGGGFYGSVLMGTPATLSASVTASGGSSGADGGSADDVVVTSFGGSSTVTGTVTVTGGAGGTTPQNGSAGALRVDFGSTCIGSDR